MPELPLDTLKLFISDLFIKKIGDIWGIESLSKYNYKKSISPRCFFLWLNKYTNRFHWIFMNDYIKITKLNDKDEYLKNQLEILRNQSCKDSGKRPLIDDKLLSESAKELLKTKNRKKLILDPTLFLEASKDTEYYKNQKGDTDIEKPDIIIAPNKKKMTDDRFREKYKEGLGLSMLSAKKGEVLYTPFAILDPRSWQPGFWDCLLGIEETIYLPLKNLKSETFEGVLIISWDVCNDNSNELEKNLIFRSDSKYDQCREILTKLRKKLKSALNGGSFKDKIEFYKETEFRDYIECLYANLTHDLVEELGIQSIFTSAWSKIQTYNEINEVLRQFPTLFDNWIESYNNYTFNFDDYVVEKYLSIIENQDNYKDISLVLLLIFSNPDINKIIKINPRNIFFRIYQSLPIMLYINTK